MLRLKLNGFDSAFVIVELIVMAAELLRTDYVLLLKCLYTFHDAVELTDDGTFGSFARVFAGVCVDVEFAGRR